jgi:hypothetical protein
MERLYLIDAYMVFSIQLDMALMEIMEMNGK